LRIAITDEQLALLASIRGAEQALVAARLLRLPREETR
jgi:hypothetical protein